MAQETTQKCIKCTDGSWVCGTNPQCPPRQKVASLGRIQFEIELWDNPGEEPPFVVRLVPLAVVP